MKAIKNTLVFVVILISSFLFFACGQKNKPIEQLTITSPQVELFLGNSKYLEFEFSPSDAKGYHILWTSSNEEIVSVSPQGKITAMGYGEATIRASVKNSNVFDDCLVKVTDGRVFKLSINSLFAKTTYYEGETFNPDGLVAKAHYESGLTKEVSLEDLEISCPDVLSLNTQQVIISYQGHSTTLDITVKPDEATSILISTLPIKQSYFIGEVFESLGMEVSLNYGSGKKEIITDYTFDTTPFSYNSNEIKIYYKEFVVALPINVQARIIINDISLLQEAINNAQDGDSIMIKEGIYNTGKSINIPSSKKIVIYGENENVYLYGHNCSIFAISDGEKEGDITLARLNLSLAQGENINLISNPNQVSINLIDMIENV